MFVSLIITTKNEERNILNCLESIEKQVYPKDQMEVVIVDNFSTDQTASKVQSFKETSHLARISLEELGPERSAQRNQGVKMSRGEYFLYLDADMILHENVVKDCVEYITENPATVALYISEIVLGKRFFSQVRRFERSFYDGTVIDCARFIKKDVFLATGGFDEQLTGPEDWDLDKKLRQQGSVSLIKTPIYHNEAEFELRKYLQKKGYYAKNFDAYIKKWGMNDPDLKKQFGIGYRFIGVFIEKKKWQKLVSHPMLTGGMFFLRFLVGMMFLKR